MRLLTAIYAVLALALCLWLGFHWRSAVVAEPRTLLDEARRSMSGPELDQGRALVELGLALEGAEAARDLPLIEEVLITRARLLRSTGGFSAARADLERVLTHYRPGSTTVEALLAGIDLDAGEVEAALARSTSVLARDHNSFEAWSVRADALLRLAERKLEAARSKASMGVSEKGVEATERLMRRIAVLDPSDRDRVRLVDELFNTFPGRDRAVARDVIEDLDDASRLFAEAPEALARSFEGAPRRETMQAYVRLLADSGDVETAANFGLCLARMPWLVHYPPFLRDLMELLLAHGRERSASDIVPRDLGQRASPDARFFGVWADVLYRNQRWNELVMVAIYLRQNGEPDQRVVANFYLGAAQAGLDRPEEALPALQRFVSQQAVEPFDGALVNAWSRLATLHREGNRPTDEYAALRRALGFSNDRTAGAGELWLRTAELSWTLPNGNRTSAVDELAHALRLLPERRDEIEPLWRERGQAVIESMRLDPTVEARAMLTKGLTMPEGRRSSFELVLIAETCAALGEDATALVLSRRILEQFPDLLPALERLSDAYARSGDARGAAETVRRQIELVGAKPELVETLEALGAADFGAQWRLDMVRLDPEGFGRRSAAELLRERGATSEAIAGLLRVPAERLGDDGRLLLARLLFDQGRDDQAQSQLAGLSGDIAVLARALPLSIDIGVRQRDAAHLSRLMRLLESNAEFDVPALLGCVDHMLRAGLIESARELCAALDERPRTRSAALYLRFAAIELLAGDLAAAEEALERAYPYDEGGGVEIGRILIEVSKRSWSALQASVGDLQATGWEPTAVQYIVAAALSERLNEAQVAAAAERETSSDDPLWPLLGASLDALQARVRTTSAEQTSFERLHGFGVSPAGGLERDPRPMLARILALGHPEWTAWAVADLARSEPPTQGALWPTYLAALGQLWSDDPRGAEATARKLTTAWPDFGPAWDVCESAIEEDVNRQDHPRLLRLFEQRRSALGEFGKPSADLFLVEARLAELRGDLESALTAAQHAVELAPTRPGALRRLAQVHRKRKEWASALSAFHRSLEGAEPESDSHPVREMLDLCQETSHLGGAAFESSLRTELDFLAQNFPADPLVALAHARRALIDFATDRRLALSRVRAILEDFRARTDRAALDDLRPDSAARWIAFIADLDPEGANKLAEDELLRQPASVELWRAVGATAERLGLIERAVEATDTAQRMLPEPETALRLVALEARRVRTRDELRPRVEQARRIAGAATDERRLSLSMAVLAMRGDRVDLGDAISELSRLWETRDAVSRPAELIEIGKLYGFALCRRGEGGDGRLARNVFQEISPRITDPTQRNLMTAMTALAAFAGR